MPGDILLEPLLSVCVGPNLHQSGFINPVKNLVRVGHVEKIHFQVRINRRVLPNMEGVTRIRQHQFFQDDRPNEGVEPKIDNSRKPWENARHQQTWNTAYSLGSVQVLYKHVWGGVEDMTRYAYMIQEILAQFCK